MKDKIIQILMSETFNTSDEAGNSYIVTSSEDFDDIAERIVKLFAIPDVIDTVCCENCVNFYPDTKTCDKTCIRYSKFKQQM